jgi:hypothetical protein
MVKVFIGGSIKITILPPSVTVRIDRMIEERFTILVGDAPGVDRAVQQYLAGDHYENVYIFHTGDHCRNNLDKWKTRTVAATARQKGYEFYAMKDAEMAAEADYGLMVWDGKSRGTRNNVHNLLKNNKPVVVFLTIDQSFYTLRKAADLFTLPI